MTCLPSPVRLARRDICVDVETTCQVSAVLQSTIAPVECHVNRREWFIDRLELSSYVGPSLSADSRIGLLSRSEAVRCGGGGYRRELDVHVEARAEL